MLPASTESTGARLGRSDRIRASREFQRVSRCGWRVSSRNFVVLLALPVAGSRVGETQFDEIGPGRLGLTVSRRVGGAVVRNRVKRRLREWFRTSASRTRGGLDMVVIARPSAAKLSLRELSVELEGLVQRAGSGASR